ncbi:hypothetical protein NDU88_001049 [Pleurodeles waltl]|uniref:Uncharacterized protein n=1 Tax=Pleurodeles waltl TaxID=8319 RepID=A0AAV7R619_PLEWA|nr:hypothetical protein NDU88_001049 [Pleurodeles waltl]
MTRGSSGLRRRGLVFWRQQSRTLAGKEVATAVLRGHHVPQVQTIGFLIIPHNPSPKNEISGCEKEK